MFAIQELSNEADFKDFHIMCTVGLIRLVHINIISSEEKKISIRGALGNSIIRLSQPQKKILTIIKKKMLVTKDHLTNKKP